MAAYLQPFCLNEEGWAAKRRALEDQLTREEDKQRTAIGRLRQQELLDIIRYDIRGSSQEYISYVERCRVEDSALMARLNANRQTQVRALMAAEQAERARLRAIPYWPYGEEESIGDGLRQPLPGERPGTLVGVSPEAGV